MAEPINTTTKIGRYEIERHFIAIELIPKTAADRARLDEIKAQTPKET